MGSGLRGSAQVRLMQVLSYGLAALAGPPLLETSPASCMRGYGAAGSASAWHAEGQGFESP
jgi:hypothetical protein